MKSPTGLASSFTVHPLSLVETVSISLKKIYHALNALIKEKFYRAFKIKLLQVLFGIFIELISMCIDSGVLHGKGESHASRGFPFLDLCFLITRSARCQSPVPGLLFLP